MAIRVLLADDHTIVRQGLRLLLQREGFEVVGEAENGVEAVRLGVKGYVVKSPAPTDLVRAIHEVLNGMMYLSPRVSRTVVQAYLAKSELPPDPLTPREREVLQLVAAGKTTKEVAELLGISVKTAESHRTHIIQKLDTSNTAGVVRYAIRQGLIQV